MHSENKKDAAERFWTAQRGRSTTKHMAPNITTEQWVYVCVEGTAVNQFQKM